MTSSAHSNKASVSIAACKIRHSVLFLAALCLASLATPLWANDTAGSGDTCLGCHAASADAPVHAILQTVHGRIGEAGGGNCAACHGASTEHSSNPVAHPPTTSFGPRWPSPAEQRDQACVTCHKSGQQMLWVGSAHHNEDVSCSGCHTLHTNLDPALAETEQAGVCYQCHTRQMAEARLPSRHPIEEGRTLCSDCHNAHGASTDFALKQVTLNDNCYSCHQEKRGPFLFEHAPAAEDCSLCHQAHGAINDDLLRARGPFLCQQCHAAAYHPSTVYSGTGLPGAQANPNLLGKNCLNCHSQVHGSNHPSGSTLTR